MRIALLVAAGLISTACADDPIPQEMPPEEPFHDGLVEPYDGLIVRNVPITLRPGVYHLEDADGDGLILLDGPGAVLDMTGVTIVGHAEDDTREPDAFTGRAVVVRDSPSARVTGGVLRGFKVAVSVARSDNAIVEDVDVSGNFRQRLGSTPEREDAADWLRPHDNDAGEWETKYGAGISVVDSLGVTVRRCRAHGGQNGLLLTRSDDARAYDNDFSFLSGWGIALYRTSDAIVCRNALDWCVRGYSHGVYDRGQDSAGILVFEQCSRNVFALNSATHGGDGFFLYAGQDTVERDGRGGSNDNLIVRNDFSHAVANAIEATFSTGNRFIENRLDDSRHGVWAGYSSSTLIAENRIRDCDNGVSIEHGQRNAIEGNEITGCATGVHLWWDDDPGLFATAFGTTRDVSSSANRIGPWNTFRRNTTDVRLRGDTGGQIVDNTFGGDAPRIRLEGACGGALFEGNDTPDARMLLEAEHEGRVRWVAGADPLGEPRLSGDGAIDLDQRQPDGMLHHGHAPDSPLQDFDPATLPGTTTPGLPDGMPRGRGFIFVDEWGPLDPWRTRLFPEHVDGARVAVFQILGVDGAFRVDSVTEGFDVEPRDGALPARLIVRGTADTGPTDFALEVVSQGTRYRATGTLLDATWDVRHFEWTEDPRNDQAAWDALLSSEPASRRQHAALDFAWQSGAPAEGVAADHFGTLATTLVTLPAGTWRLSTLSDDGIRVWIDGELVIDDWTHHAPTEHDASVALAGGTHEIRVEHFELDGWAALRVRLRPE